MAYTIGMHFGLSLAQKHLVFMNPIISLLKSFHLNIVPMKAKFYTLMFLLLGLGGKLLAAVEPVKAGSYIINMGVTPQTVGNGLKPYGLVYDLLKNHRTPVKWVISTGKSKDGIDFSHNGVDYRGGAFIIDASARTTVINAVIASWVAQGVVGNTTVSDFNVDVTRVLNYAPNWTLDKTNGHLALPYFQNAGIPSTAHGGDTAWKDPSELGACDDIFVLPHADPTWADHNNLYYWNLTHKGNIWVGCHAVSALENLKSPDGSIQMNFLSTTGLVATSLHKKHSTPPFKYSNSGDFVMQFMGILDGATTNGSERSFLPLLGGGWRPSTTLGVYDDVDTYIPSLSSGPAGVTVYGKGYGDSNRGWVMYQAGHSLEDGGSVAEQVAVQRAFLNYSFSVAAERYIGFTATVTGVEAVLTTGVPSNLSLQVPAWVDLSQYTIEWTSSNGGTFTPANSKDVTYTPPLTPGRVTISVSLVDQCDRAVFLTQASFVTGLLSNPVSLKARYASNDQKTVLDWKTEDASVTFYKIERRSDNGSFELLNRIAASKAGSSMSYEDANPPAGTLQYRLVLEYASGKIVYSNIASLKVTELVTEQIHSVVNPVRQAIRFNYSVRGNESVAVSVFDFNGKQLYRNSLQLKAGDNIIEIPRNAQWSTGMYVLRVDSKQRSVSKKLYFNP